MQRIALATLVAATLGTGIAYAASSFTAHGDAGQEVQNPPVVSKAHSQASFKLVDGGEGLEYKLQVSPIDGVRFAHIHLAPTGQNGPVVAFLVPPQSPSTGRIEGRIARGVITAADLVGPLRGQPLSALVEQLEAGGAYTNIHTDEYPGGEVRGQIG